MSNHKNNDKNNTATQNKNVAATKSNVATPKKNRRITNKEILFLCVFSVVFVFNYFVFNQLDIVLRNQSEFGILIKEVIGIYILLVFVALLLTIAALTAVLYFCRKKFPIIIATIIGIMLAGYVQILFFNNADIMNVNGHVTTSVWNYILNTAIHLAVVAAPILIVLKNKKHFADSNDTAEPASTAKKETPQKKETPLRKGLMPKIALLLAVMIFGMQAIGLLSIIPSVESPAKDNELYYFSIDKQLELSKNDNIIVFVLDRNDTDYVDTIFEDYPEYKDVFEDFTYYQDNIAQYPGTFPSVASMLTGEVFDSQRTHNQYMESAWDNPLLFEALKANNYKINGLLNSVATVHDFKEIEDKFDNIKKLDSKNRKIRHLSFFGQLLKSAIHRQSPYLTKYWFVGYIETINKSVKISNTPDYYNRTILPDSDLRFYDRLTDIGLSASEDKNVFSFVHLLASHNPFGYDHDLNERETDEISQTRGTYKILDTYFDQMKALGIFENSTIIVLADHGQWKSVKNMLGSINEPPMAALFIKEKGKGDNVALEIDSSTQMSHSNFLPSIIEQLYNDNASAANKTYLDTVKENGSSYFDVKKPVADGGLGGVQTRFYYNVRWTNMNSTKYWATYKIEGNAEDIDNWHKL